jgi:hypothetical protein
MAIAFVVVLKGAGNYQFIDGQPLIPATRNGARNLDHVEPQAQGVVEILNFCLSRVAK